jgi:hypothetical protein
MKRHALAVLIHPYKNMLADEARLGPALDELARKILALLSANPTLRLNLILPGSMLHSMNPLQLSHLREMHKSERLEWLTPGFTEPFASFSPPWLLGENIAAGHQSFQELIGVKPDGYVAPFSNWEPSSVQTLHECGIRYAVLSQSVFPADARRYCGYWTTEHVGATLPVFPSHVFDHRSAPENISEWIEQTVADDPRSPQAARQVIIEYLVPLFPNGAADPFAWLHALAKALDILLLRYQIARLGELSSLGYPVGLQFIPSSLTMKRNAEDPDRFFANYLYSFEQLGILHRKMLTVAEAINARFEGKERSTLLRRLFSVQDINRFLPAADRGFRVIQDRLWSFRRLIELESAIRRKESVRGGQIRIADYLHNGTKCVVLANKPLQLCIDLKNGGQVFAFDYRDRGLNLCAGYRDQQRTPPRIIVPGISCTAFVDRIFEPDHRDFSSGLAEHERGDFVAGAYNYKVRKTARQVKVILNRQGAACLTEKPCPVHLEKVFGLEQDLPALSFVYQLANPSLASYRFTFAVEITLCLPGEADGACRLFGAGRKPVAHALDGARLEETDAWRIEDKTAGVLLEFVVQKKVQVHMHAVRSAENGSSGAYQGIQMIIAAPVALHENGVWTLMGKASLKSISQKSAVDYAF